jgi:hypothetical protein
MEKLIEDFLKTLKVGMAGLVSIRAVKSNDASIKNYQIEIAEKLSQRGDGGLNVLGILNSGDPRFNTSGARRAWGLVKAWQAVKFFPSVTQPILDALIIGGDSYFVGQPNPTVTKEDGTIVYLKVKVSETFNGDEFDLANIERTAKRRGPNGDHIFGMNDGQLSHIFSHTDVDGALMVDNKLINQFEHTFIEEAEVKGAYQTTPQGVNFDTATGEVVDKLPSL